MILAEGLTVEFGGTTLFENISFVVNEKDRIALMGKNGAGKSTLMKILMGIYKADSGSVYLNGQEVHFHGPREAIRMGLAMIHQELNPVLDMEVAENSGQALVSWVQNTIQ